MLFHKDGTPIIPRSSFQVESPAGMSHGPSIHQFGEISIRGDVNDIHSDMEVDLRRHSRSYSSEASTTLFHNDSLHQISRSRIDQTRAPGLYGVSVERNPRDIRPQVLEFMVGSSRQYSSSGGLASVTANCSHYKSAPRRSSDTTRSIRFCAPHFSVPNEISLGLSSSTLCPVLLGQTPLDYNFVRDCRLALASELLSMPAFLPPYCGQIKTITIVFQEWDWKIEVKPSLSWGQDLIAVGDIFGAIHLHLHQPIREVTWNNASTQRRQTADMHYKTRRGRTKRRIDWLGGISTFRRLSFFGRSIGEYTTQGGVWIVSFAPGSTTQPTYHGTDL